MFPFAILDADFNTDSTELPAGVYARLVVWRQEARLVSSIQEKQVLLVIYEEVAARCGHAIPEEDRERFIAPYEK
jgi:hypothetical protein